jgi:uncharacterized protein (TIGR02145 family)
MKTIFFISSVLLLSFKMQFTMAQPIGHVIDSDGNVYPTVKIGNHEWMAENLRVTHYRNGTAIPKISINTQWSSLIAGAYCWYNNDESTNKNLYGALYNGYAVLDSRILCPIGWHVPTQSEWTELSTFLGGGSVAGGKMKVAVIWLSPNAGATNTSGFSGYPGGLRGYNGNFAFAITLGCWWTSTLYDASNLWYWDVYYQNAGLYNTNWGDYRYGFSVRCVKD